MTSTSGIPRPFNVTDAKRAREEESRRRERATSARNTSSTTVGAGGRLDIDGGDFSVFNGGNAVVRDGGRFLVQGGGSMDISDDGEVVVTGEGQDWATKEPIPVRACMGNRDAFNTWVSLPYKQPGFYFNSGESRGALDPRIVSEDGFGLNLVSAVELLRYGPHVGPNIMSSSNSRISPDSASIGSGSWDDIINPGGGDGLAGLKGQAYGYFTPNRMLVAVDNYDLTDPSTPQGTAVSVGGNIEDGILQLFGRNGVNVTGAFTVDGSPVTAPVTSVAGRAGDVVLAKADVGLGNVDNTSDIGKPVSTATQAAIDVLKSKFKRVLGTGLPGTLTAAASWVSFGATVTVPTDLFGPGVPYLVTAYAQASGFPVSGAVFSLRVLFNGTQPNGAKTNSPNGPHNATTSIVFDYEVTTSAAVTVSAQAQSVFGSSAIATGADQAFYTVTATPYAAL